MFNIHCRSELLNVEECDATGGHLCSCRRLHQKTIELYKRWKPKERVSSFISSVSPFWVQAEQ